MSCLPRKEFDSSSCKINQEIRSPGLLSYLCRVLPSLFHHLLHVASILKVTFLPIQLLDTQTWHLHSNMERRKDRQEYPIVLNSLKFFKEASLKILTKNFYLILLARMYSHIYIWPQGMLRSAVC